MLGRFGSWCAVVVLGAALSGCGDDELERLKQENAALKAEVTALKQTAQYHYQRGQDLLAKEDWAAAEEAFKTVLAKFPKDPLVPEATKALAKATEGRKATEELMAAIEKDHAEARAREEAQSGEEMEYATFYAKSRTGLPVGKRYRFDACLSSDASCIDARSEFVNQMICGIATDFDDPSELEAALSEGRRTCGPMVASMSSSGTVRLHRLH